MVIVEGFLVFIACILSVGIVTSSAFFMLIGVIVVIDWFRRPADPLTTLEHNQKD